MLLLTALLICGISGFLYISSHPRAMKGANTDNTVSPGALQFKVTKEDLVNSVEVKGKSSYEKETRVYAPLAAKLKRGRSRTVLK